MREESWTVADDCRPCSRRHRSVVLHRDALHVVGINWENDGRYLGRDLVGDGLRIPLDAPPDPASLTNDTIHVAIELPYPPPDQPVAHRARAHPPPWESSHPMPPTPT